MAAASRAGKAKPVTVPQQVKKPCATSAEDLFTKSQKVELHVVDSKILQGGSTTLGDNLNVYQDVKKTAFKDLSNADKAH